MHLDRTIAPPLAELVSSDTIIQPQIISADSGARIHILHNNIQPVAKVEFVFRAGKWYQPKAGVASLTAKMLMEGTAHKSAKQLADVIDFYGASMDVNHSFDRASLSLYCLAKFLPNLLPIAFEVLQEPAYLEEDLTLLKQRVIQTLSVDKQKNSYLSSELFTSTVYGKNHPYSTLIEEEDIQAITTDDLKSFHKASYQLSTAEVFVAGDVNEEVTELILSKLNSVTANNSIVIPDYPNTSEEATKGLKKLPTSNKMQASIRVGKKVIAPTHEDYPALYLLNHAFGGYFGSRLMRNIREDKGFTYGIYSSLSIKEHDTMFTIGTDIKGDKVEETLTEIEKEISTLQSTPLSDIELNTVKKHIAGKFISDLSTIFDQIDKYRSTVLLGLPADFYVSLLAKAQKLNAEDLQRAAATHLQKDSLLSVVAGGEVS